MRIGVFGGSFDPIHHGHLIVAELLAEALDLGEVRVVPAAQQPFKVGRHSASAVHRAAMVELATEGSSLLTADRIEVDRPGPSYTVETLRAFHAARPDARLVLLLGSDAAEDFPQWWESSAIPDLAEVVVFQRSGTAGGRFLGDRTVVLPHIGISSTAVRERIRAGRPVRYWVPEAVDRYIAAHGLYRD